MIKQVCAECGGSDLRRWIPTEWVPSKSEWVVLDIADMMAEVECRDCDESDVETEEKYL